MDKSKLKVGMKVETAMSEKWGIATILALGKTHAFVSYDATPTGYYENSEIYCRIKKILEE